MSRCIIFQAKIKCCLLLLTSVYLYQALVESGVASLFLLEMIYGIDIIFPQLWLS